MRDTHNLIQKECNQKFFKNLNKWIHLISKVDFKCDEMTKIDLIISSVIKLVFIQNLDELGIIESQWLKNIWDSFERRWHSKNKFVLKNFFEQIENLFHEYYDADAFKGNILDYVDEQEDNIAIFYKNLQLILGLDNSQNFSNDFRGIIQYKYLYINEDIFGKAYEIYLAEIRHDKGIYYTPAYIVEFIVENTVGKVFDQLLAKIELQMNEENFEEVKRLAHKFIAIKVLDPACGSGSFLIKALRTIQKKYAIFNQLIKEVEDEFYRDRDLNHSSEKTKTKLNQILVIKNVLGTKNEHEVIAKILIRHIYGCDLDVHALNIAKVSIWLEAIKMVASLSNLNNLRNEAKWSFSELELNFIHGNAIMGLPDKRVFEFFRGKKRMLRQLFEMMKIYLADPSNQESLNKIEDIKANLRKKLDEYFLEHLGDMNLTSDILKETIPLHWVLEFWQIFFDQDGNPLGDDAAGFDVVIGNPPYIDSETMTKVIPNIRKYCAKRYESASGNWDIFCPFIEMGVKRTKKEGFFSYIVPNKLLSADYADATRLLLKRYKIELIRDYSRVNVFDAAVYPILFVLNKKSWQDKDVIVIEILSETNENVSKAIQRYEISLKELNSFSSNNWALAQDSALNVFNKIITNSSALKNYSTIRGAATVSEAYKIAEKLKEISDVKQFEYQRFINTGTIDKYVSLWGVKPLRYIKKTYLKPVILSEDLAIISEKRLKETKSKKIIIAGMGLELECIYDNGEYLAGKSTVIVSTDRIRMKALVGVLNSSLSTFILKKMFGSLTLRGGYLRIGPPQIREMLISGDILNSEKAQKSLERLVDRIKRLKKNSIRLRELWQSWSAKMKSRNRTLHQILFEDRRKRKEGKISKTWSVRADFYHDQKTKLMKKSFDRFKVKANDDRPILGVYGIHGDKETLVCDIMFVKRSLMTHVYLSIHFLLHSKKKVQCLAQLFSKTDIAVILPDSATKTPNILKKVEKDFIKWQKGKQTESIQVNIIKCDNEIERLQAEIDAYVFCSHGLTRDEIKTIMKSLTLPTSYKKLVLKYILRNDSATPSTSS